MALAQAEWAAWSDSLLLEWDDERLVVREQFPNLSRDDAEWIAWARVRVGFSERRGHAASECRQSRPATAECEMAGIGFDIEPAARAATL